MSDIEAIRGRQEGMYVASNLTRLFRDCLADGRVLMAEVDRLQAIVDNLPTRTDGTLYDDYAVGPKAVGWCIWRYDHQSPWRVSHCTRGDATLGDGYPEWQIDDVEDDCEVGGVYETKETAEKAVR